MAYTDFIETMDKKVELDKTAQSTNYKFLNCFPCKKKSSSENIINSNKKLDEAASFKLKIYKLFENISKSTYYEYFALKAMGGIALGVAMGYSKFPM